MPRLPAPLKRGCRRVGAAALSLLALATSACDDPPRVPYIPATLHNWEKPQRGHPALLLHVFEVGRLAPAETMPGTKRTRHILAYVLEHPKQGLVVLDTGLNHAIATDEEYVPEELSYALRVELRAGEDLPSQMRKANLDPAKVRRVALSNLRLSHAGEIEAFAQARVSVARREDEIARRAPPGYRMTEYDDVKDWDLMALEDAPPLGTMTAALDLLGDGSVMMVAAPGPTEGNAAFLLRLAERPVLLVGDVAPYETSLRRAVAPPALRDPEAWWQTIWRVKRFAYLDPEILVVPGYEAKTWRDSGLASVRLHEPVAAPTSP